MKIAISNWSSIGFDNINICLLLRSMESRSYNFSTARKRSTLLESKGIEYTIIKF